MEETTADEQTAISKAAKEFVYRTYQLELLEKSVECNTIVCLKTGAGKTMIAILLIKELQHQILGDFRTGGKRTVFLVPKVPLVHQQSKAIKAHLPLKVGSYFGSMGVDYWDQDKWQKELIKHNVMVMTAQILLNLLNRGFMQLKQINLLIFDECHAATGNSPYVGIMSRFQGEPERSRPRVLGLTASIVNGKCKPAQVEATMQKLEDIMRSRIETANNMASVQRHATKPREVIVTCGDADISGKATELKVIEIVSGALELMKPMLQRLEERKVKELGGEPKFGSAKPGRNEGRSSFADLIKQLHNWADEDEFQLSDGMDFGKSPSAMLKNLLAVMVSLGLYCARILIEHFLRDIPKLREDAVLRFDHDEELLYDIVHNTLEEIGKLLQAHCGNSSEPVAMTRHVTPRLARLLELLADMLERCDVEPDPDEQAETPDVEMMDVDNLPMDDLPADVATDAGKTFFRGIVFVEQRVVAWILSEYLQRIRVTRAHDYGGLRPCYMVGHGMNVAFLKRSAMTHLKQDESLEDFRSGKCNVMVATKVVEEGLDIPKCNLVVRFDQPKDFCSYVQSMGRARAERALYVMLVDKEDLNTLMEDVAVYKMIERILHLKSHNRKLPSEREVDHRLADFHKLPPYYPTTPDAACLTINNAVELIYWYCNYLPGDTFSLSRPSFKYELDAHKQVRCILRLPVNSMHHQLIQGDLMADRKLAKKAVAYRACILLHQNGELSDFLLPSVKYLDKFLVMLGIVPNDEDLNTANFSAPGTKQRRRLYTRAVAAELSNNLPLYDRPAYLHAITFEAEGCEERCCYGLLASKPLPLVSPFVVYEKLRLTVRFRRLASPSLSTEQLSLLTDFHRTLFAKMLLLASDVMTYVGDQASSSHLIVPLDERGYDPENSAGIGIDWKAVSRFARYEAEASGTVANHRPRSRSDYGDFRKGAVVSTLHRASENRSDRFVVLELCRDKNPSSPFPSNTYPSYAHYFHTKYEATVTDMDQPLIYVDYAPNSFNLLQPSLPKAERSNERRFQYLIPELCSVLPLDVEMYRQAMAVPCSLHRLNGMLNAGHLLSAVMKEAALIQPNRIVAPLEPLPMLESAVAACPVTDEVIFSPVASPVDTNQAHLTSLFFQSLTTRSASNWDDLERLEVIGDSFLKFATSEHLFCRFPFLHEGALSLLRTGLVKNHNLYHHGSSRSLPNLLNATSFTPRTMWLPPGYAVSAELSAALVEASVPFHLWPHAKPEDVALLAGRQEALLKCLHERWERVDPAHRDNARPAVPDGTARSASNYASDDESEGESFVASTCYNHFEQQLIGDKTVADAAEALVGAVLASCGQQAAVKFLVWLGLKVGPEKEAAEGGGPWEPPGTALLINSLATEQDLANMYAPLEELERRLGYTFKEKSFLLQAVVHPSYTRHPVTDNYQRLEFLGDAVLDYLVTMHLYQKLPGLSPGDLTDLRSSLVDNSTFAFLSVRSEFHKQLKYFSQELYQKINSYLNYHERLAHPKDMLYMVKEDETLDLDEIEVPKALGDVFESIAGAIYLDCGLKLDVVWRVVYPMMAELIERYTRELPINPIRVLIEKFPSTSFSSPVKCERVFTVKVTIKGKSYCGCGKNKRVARQAAAKAALRALHIYPVRKLI